MASSTARLKLVAGSHGALSAALLFGIWVALPARWWLVDSVGTALAVLCAASAVGLLAKLPWGQPLALATCWLLLGAGCSTVTALCLVVAHLAGLYGPVGAGGALLMGTMAVLVLPYLVALPALQLVWLRQGSGESRES